MSNELATIRCAATIKSWERVTAVCGWTTILMTIASIASLVLHQCGGGSLEFMQGVTGRSVVLSAWGLDCVFIGLLIFSVKRVSEWRKRQKQLARRSSPSLHQPVNNTPPVNPSVTVIAEPVRMPPVTLEQVQPRSPPAGLEAMWDALPNSEQLFGQLEVIERTEEQRRVAIEAEVSAMRESEARGPFVATVSSAAIRESGIRVVAHSAQTIRAAEVLREESRVVARSVVDAVITQAMSHVEAHSEEAAQRRIEQERAIEKQRAEESLAVAQSVVSDVISSAMNRVEETHQKMVQEVVHASFEAMSARVINAATRTRVESILADKTSEMCTKAAVFEIDDEGLNSNEASAVYERLKQSMIKPYLHSLWRLCRDLILCNAQDREVSPKEKKLQLQNLDDAFRLIEREHFSWNAIEKGLIESLEKKNAKLKTKAKIKVSRYEIKKYLKNLLMMRKDLEWKDESNRVRKSVISLMSPPLEILANFEKATGSTDKFLDGMGITDTVARGAAKLALWSYKGLKFAISQNMPMINGEAGTLFFEALKEALYYGLLDDNLFHTHLGEAFAEVRKSTKFQGALNWFRSTEEEMFVDRLSSKELSEHLAAVKGGFDIISAAIEKRLSAASS